jgi:hypothetical protein
MSSLIKMMVLVVLFFAPLGCASLQSASDNPLEELPFHYDHFDFKTGWKAYPTPNGMAVEVLLKNERYLSVEEMDLTVSLLRQGEQVVAQETVFFPGSIRNAGYGSFVVVLKNQTAIPGDRLRFLVRYSATEGSSASKWMSSFTADLLTGTVIRGKGDM